MSEKTKKDSAIQGLTHLIMDATIGVTDLVEEMHKQVLNPPFLPSTAIQKLITSITSNYPLNYLATHTRPSGTSERPRPSRTPTRTV